MMSQFLAISAPGNTQPRTLLLSLVRSVSSNSIRRWEFLGRLGLALSTVVLALSFNLPSVSAQALTSVEVATPPAEEITPLLYGIRSGIFRRLGLDVKVTFLNNGAAVAAAVVGGTMQFGQTSAFTSILAIARGVPVKIVAPSSVYTPTYPFGILVKNDSPIRTAVDFNGKTFATPSLNDYSSLFLQAWVDQNGGSSQSMKGVELPSSAMLAALAQGRVDAVTFAGPLLAQAVDSNAVRLIAKPMASVVGRNNRFVLADYFTTASYAQSNPRVVQAFARGVLESNAYVNKHHPETSALVAEILKIDPQVVDRSDRLQFREAIDPNDLQPFVELLSKYKIIDKAMDVTDLYAPAALGAR
jgi:NitT/TauT family transport system substrate-binding protein